MLFFLLEDFHVRVQIIGTHWQTRQTYKDGHHRQQETADNHKQTVFQVNQMIRVDTRTLIFHQINQMSHTGDHNQIAFQVNQMKHVGLQQAAYPNHWRTNQVINTSMTQKS
jgi:hypothetical protein